MPVLVSTCKHDKQYLFHHNLKSSSIPAHAPPLSPANCACVCGGGTFFTSVRQCLHPSVRGFRISNNKEVSDKFQKHVLVIMTFAFVTSYCFRQKLCFELNVYATVYQNIPLSLRDRTIFTFSEFGARQSLDR